jgi:biotin operon repressor
MAKKENEKEILLAIYALIRHKVGEKAAITSSKILHQLEDQKLKISSEELRGCINKLRHKGYCICSSHKGYYWAASIQDIKITKQRLIDRAKAQLETIKALDKIEKNYGNK